MPVDNSVIDINFQTRANTDPRRRGPAAIGRYLN
jgi:hypothetical protein